VLGTSACAVALGLAAACGGASAPAASSAAALPAPVSAAADPNAGHGGMSGMAGMPGMSSSAVELYAVQTGTLGVVVTDGGGRLLYGSDQDGNNPPTSHCTGTCAQEWLPLVVPQGEQPDLLGVDPDQVGRLTRDDGSSQLTLGGWPVYVNISDTGELKAAAPDAYGAWFVITPQGKKVPV
jgi:predicted lipoprotein with Yx(FWY)xxD motif